MEVSLANQGGYNITCLPATCQSEEEGQQALEDMQNEANPLSGATGSSPFGSCGLDNVGIGNCIGHVMYGIFIVSGHTMAGAGILFDYLLHFGISPNIINQTFVEGAWENIRDLANAAFIFILLWISIATILRIPKNTAKDLLHKVIIVALLINFSLFVTRVIIDAGNMAALFFYDSFKTTEIGNLNGRAEQGAALKSDAINRDGREVKGVSTTLMTKIDPQQMLQEREDMAQTGDVWKLVFLYVASFTMMFYMAWIFFITGFLFLSRIVVLWILMAASPLAFVSMILPQSSSPTQKYFWKELVGKSFCIVIFLFFVWLAVIFADPSNATNLFLASDNTSGLNFLEFIIVLALKFGVIILLLKYGKDQTDKRCGSFAGVSLDISKRVAGLAGGALGLAAGGVGGAVLRKRLGGLATSLGKDEARRQSWGQNWAGRLALRGLDTAATSSFDIRRTKIGGQVGADKNIGAWGKDRGKGGFKGKMEQREKENIKLADSFGKVGDKYADAARKEFAENLQKESLPTFMKIGNIPESAGLAVNSIFGKLKKIGKSEEERGAIDAKLTQQKEEIKARRAQQAEDMKGLYQSAPKGGKMEASGKILKKVDAGKDKRLEKERDEAKFEALKKDDRFSSLAAADASPGEWKTASENTLGVLNVNLRNINLSLKKEAKREESLLATLNSMTQSERTGPEGKAKTRELETARDAKYRHEKNKIDLEGKKKDLEQLSKLAEKTGRNLRDALNKSSEGSGDKKDAEKK